MMSARAIDTDHRLQRGEGIAAEIKAVLTVEDSDVIVELATDLPISNDECTLTPAGDNVKREAVLVQVAQRTADVAGSIAAFRDQVGDIVDIVPHFNVLNDIDAPPFRTCFSNQIVQTNQKVRYRRLKQGGTDALLIEDAGLEECIAFPNRTPDFSFSEPCHAHLRYRFGGMRPRFHWGFSDHVSSAFFQRLP